MLKLYVSKLTQHTISYNSAKKERKEMGNTTSFEIGKHGWEWPLHEPLRTPIA